jgi:glycine/D-amino acid oxidase-like deaminating enzyme
MRLVVAGNGILALATARRWAEIQGVGAEICILGERARPGSASLAAGAMLHSFAELEPYSLAHPLGRRWLELSLEATTLWRATADLGPGTYVLDGPDDAARDAYAAIRTALVERGEVFEEGAAKDVPHYAPVEVLATRALHLPREGFVNPRRALRALGERLERLPNVRFIEGRVRALRGKGTIHGAELTDGSTVEGDVYLLATGASAWDVLRESGLALPIPRVFYGLGVTVELELPGHAQRHCLRTPNRSPRMGVYTVPYPLGTGAPENHVLVGASSQILPSPRDDDGQAQAAQLVREAARVVNRSFVHASPVRVNVGYRPVSQDTYPLVGATSVNNLFLATGTRRDGFHLSPVLARHLGALMSGKPGDERLLPFAPERKLLSTFTRAEAIAHAVRALPPTEAQDTRERLERLHDLVGAVDFGVPPELIEMYERGFATFPLEHRTG